MMMTAWGKDDNSNSHTAIWNMGVRVRWVRWNITNKFHQLVVVTGII